MKAHNYYKIMKKKLSASYNKAEDMKTKDNEKGGISPILLNKIPIGKVCLPMKSSKLKQRMD